MTRRDFVSLLPAGTCAAAAPGGPIDRRALVSRHDPVLDRIDPRASLSVGNGTFAFTADVTGLQTFPEFYEKSVPLCTQSEWGWHTVPSEFKLADLRLAEFETYGRKVSYMFGSRDQQKLQDWLRQNPHRLHLGKVGLVLPEGGLQAIDQRLDLWNGTLRSRFQIGGAAVAVETCCHPELDMIAAAIESPGFAVSFDFPYGSPEVPAADWNQPDKHRSTILKQSSNRVEILRELDRDRYFVVIEWEGAATLERHGPHGFRLRPARENRTFRFTCLFTPRERSAALPPPARAFEASRQHWNAFWTGGAALELEGSRDGRAKELERRIVLSQYLTRIQCCGTAPPQETGLTCNSWYGRPHLEMHWWHAAHFALWGRTPLLERSLDWYQTILPKARAIAVRQGYAGVRWPKMVGPDGQECPSPVGVMLIWQQPHPIAYAELCYQSHPDRATLDKYREIVFQTAEFMASYAHWDDKTRRYVLGPPLIPAQENHPPRETWNPTYELEYWHWGLGIAQRWRERLKLPPEPSWERVRAHLSKLPVKDGVYLAHENCPRTFTERNRDHPSMLMALGILPGAKVDRETMRRTLHKVFDVWKWPDTWGWDYPMVAMTAARLNEPEKAVDALLLDTPKNVWQPNGHNYQRPNLPLYLPGNGGLLAAVAMMAAGWQGGPSKLNPGFPERDWTVRWEGLKAYL